MATVQEIANGAEFETNEAIRELARFILTPATVTVEQILDEPVVPAKAPRKGKDVTDG